MNSYFNVSLEFNHERFHSQIENLISNKSRGYVCVVDSNVLTISQKDIEYRKVLNSSNVNTCDGSSIALMASSIYRKKFRALNGPDIFTKYIEKNYCQLLLGGTIEISNKIKNTLESKGYNSNHILALPLPFLSVNDFDYLSISEQINKIQPDIIWVSLGAPKQEKFMYKLLPYLNKGVMFGIGAAFCFYIGDLSLPKINIYGLRFIWLNRLFNEPKKLIKRLLNFIIIVPKLYYEENKRYKTFAGYKTL